MKSSTRALYCTCTLWMSVQKNSLNAVGNMLEWNLKRKRDYGSI